MSNKANQSKSDFVNLFLSTAENDSSSKEAAKEFLASCSKEKGKYGY